MAKKKEEVKIAMRIIAKQFNENEVYSGKEIKEKINEFYPGYIEFDKKEEKNEKPYKKA